ncbi:MAG: chitobiase/beta-hexosaminidase C-terminal domain-containing protein [Atopobiaceae bacterium]|jgi:C1A family cysteine protease|nr:chitobiase/beta-hexosaminidase C-terminal domain-containing protein [Atopobiaceae bacterium]
MDRKSSPLNKKAAALIALVAALVLVGPSRAFAACDLDAPAAVPSLYASIPDGKDFKGYSVLPNSPYLASTVILSTTSDGASIYYTLDGTDPIDASTGVLSSAATLYQDPLPVAGNMTIRAASVKGLTGSQAQSWSNVSMRYVKDSSIYASFSGDTDDESAEVSAADPAGSWTRVRYSSLPQGMSASPASLPYCYESSGNGSAGSLQSTVLQPVLKRTGSSPALCISVWRDSSYDGDDSVTPFYVAPSAQEDQETHVTFGVSIPLKTTGGESDGWYEYAFDLSAVAGQSVWCGVETSATSPAYVDDLYAASDFISSPTWSLSTSTYQDGTTLSLAEGNPLYLAATGLKLTQTRMYAAVGNSAKTPTETPDVLLPTSASAYQDALTPSDSTTYVGYSDYTLMGVLSYRSPITCERLFEKTCLEPEVTLEDGTEVGDGDYPYGTKVYISSPTPGASIKCTRVMDKLVTDHGQMTAYSGPYTLTGDMGIRACATKAGYLDSDAITCTVTCVPGPSVEACDAASQPGVVHAGQQVSLKLSTTNSSGDTVDTKGYSIYYTTDGTEPYADENGTIHGTLYAGPIAIDTDTQVIARALKTGAAGGDPCSFSYQVSTAADIYEPDDSASAARSISFPFEVTATLDTASDVDWYRLEVSGAGAYTFSLGNPAGHAYRLDLCSANGTPIDTSMGGTDSSSVIRALPAGTYLLEVTGDGSASTDAYTLLATKNVEGTANGSDPVDLSEASMVAHLFSNESPTAWLKSTGARSGATEKKALSYYANWDGPVSEATEPYPTSAGSNFVDPLTKKIPLPTAFPYYSRTAHPELYHLEQALCFDNEESTESLKAHLEQAVYCYGAATFSLDWASVTTNKDSPTIVGDKGAYYYLPPADPETGFDPSSLNANGHEVALVGWDDSIPKEHFSVTIDGNTYTPAHDGGFIVKNQWGTAFGDAGYYYISYDTAGLETGDSLVCLESADDYDTLYEHAPMGSEYYFNFATPTGYEKCSYTAESSETLRAVSFWSCDENADYDVWVQVGDGQGRHVASGSHACPGLYNVRLDEGIELAQGQDFTITVRLSTRDGSALHGILQYPGESSGTENFAKYCAPGWAEVSEDGTNWQDLAAMSSSIYVAALTEGTDTEGSNVVIPTNGNATTSSALSPQDAGITAIENISEVNSTPVDASSELTTQSTSLDLPDKFDLRDINGDGTGVSAVTSVKNQIPYNTCWAFALTASAESVLMRRDGFAYSYPISVSASADQVIHLTEENPTVPVDLTGTVTTEKEDVVSSDYVAWSYSGDLDSVDVQGTGSSSGASATLLTAKAAGTVTATATSAADTLKKASTTITIVDDRTKDSGDSGGQGTADSGTDTPGTQQPDSGVPTTGDGMPLEAAALLAAGGLALLLGAATINWFIRLVK